MNNFEKILESELKEGYYITDAAKVKDELDKLIKRVDKVISAKDKDFGIKKAFKKEQYKLIKIRYALNIALEDEKNEMRN